MKIPLDHSFDNPYIRSTIFRQAGKIITSLGIPLIFGAIQWIRSKQTARFGIIDYWRHEFVIIPNDYKLIVFGSLISILLTFILTITMLIDKKKINPFL